MACARPGYPNPNAAVAANGGSPDCEIQVGEIASWAAAELTCASTALHAPLSSELATPLSGRYNDVEYGSA
jgi:hypothetical protein